MAVYGSLKEGHFNYIEADKKGSCEIEGWDMYAPNKYYPAVVRGEGTIQVEVFEYSDLQLWQISQMEVGAGYVPEIVDTPFGPALLWRCVLKFKRKNKIKDGNW